MKLVDGLAGLTCCLLMFSYEVATAQNLEKKIDVELSEKRWTTLILLGSKSPQAQPIPAKAPLKSVTKLEFEGPNSGNPHLLNKYQVEGKFVIQNGFLVPQGGNSALLQLPPSDSFQLEGYVGLKGAGGCLILFGWDLETKSGHCLYHSQLRTEGAPWRLCRIEDGKMAPGSDVLLKHEKIDGEGALRMQVVDHKSSLSIFNKPIMNDYQLTDYSAGAIMIGTFNPRYGPKQIGIHSLRMKGW